MTSETGLLNHEYELINESQETGVTLTSGKVSTLAHEAGDDAVESRSLIAEPFLAGAKSAEVFARFGADVRIQRHDDTSGGTATDLHIEENVLLCHLLN